MRGVALLGGRRDNLPHEQAQTLGLSGHRQTRPQRPRLTNGWLFEEVTMATNRIAHVAPVRQTNHLKAWSCGSLRNERLLAPQPMTTEELYRWAYARVTWDYQLDRLFNADYYESVDE